MLASIRERSKLLTVGHESAAKARHDRVGRLVYSKDKANRAQNYRYWVIWRCPSVRYLDFVKVRDIERKQAKDLFGTVEEPTDLASKIIGVKSKSFVVPTYTNGVEESTKERIYTDDEKRRMRAAILNASSLAEMAKLEKDFAEGRIPQHILEGGDPMET